jgi:hypothetical protein
MHPRIRKALLVAGAGLLVIAGFRFIVGFAGSFHSEAPVPQADGGFQIDHIVEIDHWRILTGVIGAAALVVAVIGSSRKTPRNEI